MVRDPENKREVHFCRLAAVEGEWHPSPTGFSFI